MSKHSFLGFIITFIVIIVVISLYYNFSAKDSVEPTFDDTVVTSEPQVTNSSEPTDDSSSSTANNEVNENSGAPTNTFTYTNEFGSGDKTTTVNAVQAEKLSGFSGASNNVFYIDGKNDLYYLELTNLVKTKLASNVDHFEQKGGQVTAYFKRPHDVYEENRYVTYKELN